MRPTKMDTNTAIKALGALAQDTRLAIFRLLVEQGRTGLAVGAIVEALDLPPSSLSFHLAHLRHAGLVIQRRERRSLIYSVDFELMGELMGYLTDNCCGGNPAACLPRRASVAKHVRFKRPAQGTTEAIMQKRFNVLFLCTGNSARSLMAEAVLNHRGGSRFRAFSAGSHPTGKVNPAALDLLTRLDLPVNGLRSKSWDEFAAPDAPVMDFVFTVCDQAAGEVCPIWPGQPITAHWRFPDPAAFVGPEAEKRAVFAEVFRQIENRIKIFVALPHERLDRLALGRRVREIGETAPARG